MFKILRSLVLISLVLVLAVPGAADEGMWLPHQMKDLNLEAQGLKMDPNDLYKKDGTGLMSAVVYFGGGTGEFVSPKGLILTNHHVAFGAIQRASDKEHDYITHGFLAKTMKDEIPAKGNISDVLLGYDDVTASVTKVVKSWMTPIQKYNALDKVKKRLIAKEEKKGKDLRCVIRGMYSGNKYYMFRFKRLRDIRLVYAPPRAIGNFGGDIDNWMWPRHTGDFTYFRAYVSKDNVGAPYSPDNVPYQPKSHLKISLDGLDDGDFSFVMGYPGRTYRNYTLPELGKEINRMNRRKVLFREMIDFFVEAGKDDRGIQIKYASLVKSLNNALKNYQGKLEGLEKSNVLKVKEAQHAKFMEWVKADPTRQKKYGDILQKIDQYMKKRADFDFKVEAISGIAGRRGGAAMLAQSYLIYRAALERLKPDMKRERGFQKRDMPYIELGVKMAERSYHFDTDKAFCKFLFGRMLEYKPEQWPLALKPVLEKGKDAIDKYVDELYAKTVLKDPKKRMEMLKMSPAKLLKTGDPLIKLAAGMEKEYKQLREKEKALGQELLDLRKVYMAAVLEMSGGNIAPDANSTIRFTCGTVKGYRPKDAVYFKPHATLKGVIEKEQEKFPFSVPAKLKELHKKKDFGPYVDKKYNDVVTCFLNTTNVTGGNSGSPVLNAKGEQVGIIFDMTYESVTGDYYIIPEFQRTISVDIRYVLFVTDKFGGAHHLIEEMGLK